MFKLFVDLNDLDIGFISMVIPFLQWLSDRKKRALQKKDTGEF